MARDNNADTWGCNRHGLNNNPEVEIRPQSRPSDAKHNGLPIGHDGR